MTKIELDLPIDLSFTNMLLYEGILYISSYEDLCKAFDTNKVELDKEFLRKIYSRLKKDRYNNIEINLKDDKNINKLINSLGISNVSKTLDNLFDKLTQDVKIVINDDILLGITKIKNKEILYGLNELDKNNKFTFRLFKIDRYTGISSLEHNYTTKQITSYFSRESILIALLGIYSSFVRRIYVEKTNVYYFLFFSPDEILYILSSKDRSTLKTFMNIKDKVNEVLQKVFDKTNINEVLLLEVLLNTEIHELMKNNNLDKLSTILFRIHEEGKTYKIYEIIPLIIYKDTIFHAKLNEYFKNENYVIRFIESFFKNPVIEYVLRNMNTKNKSVETDNIIRAIQNLYRLVILGDVYAYYNFVRELVNAYQKVKSNKRDSSEQYLKILNALPL